MKDFLKDIIKDVLKTLIIPALAPIGSKIATGSWLKWFEYLSLWVWFAILALVFFLIFILQRYKVVRSYGKTEFASGSIPSNGLEELKERIPHDDVIWVVRRDGRGRDANRLFPRNDPRPSQICIKTPAVCPNCATELKETHVWSGFTWHCINGDFKKHSKVSFYKASKDVELLARRKIEGSTGFSSDG